MGVEVDRRAGCGSAPIFQKLVDNEGIWEVRIHIGNNIFRLLGFFDRGTLLILTNGFAKKTQKTPPQEIALAIRRKEEYLARRIRP
jgi:phage-related protein